MMVTIESECQTCGERFEYERKRENGRPRSYCPQCMPRSIKIRQRRDYENARYGA